MFWNFRICSYESFRPQQLNRLALISLDIPLAVTSQGLVLFTWASPDRFLQSTQKSAEKSYICPIDSIEATTFWSKTLLKMSKHPLGENRTTRKRELEQAFWVRKAFLAFHMYALKEGWTWEMLFFFLPERHFLICLPDNAFYCFMCSRKAKQKIRDYIALAF